VKSDSGRRFVSLPPAAVVLLKRWLLVVPSGDGFEDPERPGRRLHPLFPTSIGSLQGLANIYHRMWVPLLVNAGLVDWIKATTSAVDLGSTRTANKCCAAFRVIGSIRSDISTRAGLSTKGGHQRKFKDAWVIRPYK
jgi:hypothetical protein